MGISNWIAMAAGFLLTLVIGHFLIPELRKLKAGQSIRADGPTWHAGKAGTPAMGGIMFIVSTGVLMIALGWRQILQGEFAHLYVYLFALVFGIIGFVGCGINYPIYKKKLEKGKAKYAYEIVELARQISEQE